MTDFRPAAPQETLRRGLAALGFDDARFASLAAPPSGQGLRAWLDAGYHGEMRWMERTADKRLDPGRVLSGARSIILLGVNYLDRGAAARSAPGAPGGPALPAALPIWARYSLYEDYHDTLKPALIRAGRLIEEIYGVGGGDYRYYVDTGPVLERSWAARAGLGFVGKNAMLISRRHGNWLFLAAILTRVDLAPDPPVRKTPGEAGQIGLLCGKCTRCLDACPTAAFPRPGVVDARRCLSYLTIENRGAIPREFRSALGRRIYGCDICLEVCPWNRFARRGRQLLLAARGELGEISLRELLALTPEIFAATFRRTPIKRIKWAGLLRNACVAAGNSGDSTLVEPLLALAAGDSALVRAHAVWALFRLGAGSRLSGIRATETDPGVLAEYRAEAAP